MSEKQSFVVEIVNQQNRTWQGNVLWVQEQKKVPFRSALELMELIQSAVGFDDTEEEDRTEST